MGENLAEIAVMFFLVLISLPLLLGTFLVLVALPLLLGFMIGAVFGYILSGGKSRAMAAGGMGGGLLAVLIFLRIMTQR